MQAEIPKGIGRDAMRSRRKPFRRSSVPACTEPSRQLPLPIGPPTPLRSPSPSTTHPVPRASRTSDATLASDQVLKTRQVLQITGCHRSTIYRRMRAGTFPRQHSSKGWRRSDIERWLADEPKDSG
ncbi:helix-turn-helix transcriptional regulator [Steroidobacter agaridevorans]|uniref:helix-turn-helix transcriptional regulator n=1 Tax=Steroidobacter agaridevorans TaxID=2695856 RepID=UPI003899D013